ncbi:hypothetical protein BN871_AJ_00020 [Paenibacillus sp. P22]|nr:hypothetical protein BN871_AJ_00020 [Paenibacillus sp. P22]
MRAQQAVVAWQHRAQLRKLFLGRIAAGGVEQADRQADGAGAQPLLQQLLHPAQLRGSGRAVVEAHDGDPQGAMGDVGRHMFSRSGSGDIVHVFADRIPLPVMPGTADDGGNVAAQQLLPVREYRRRSESAVADDLGGDALAELDLAERMVEDHEIRMAVAVDEAGGNDASLNIDRLRRLRVHAADSGNHSILHAYVAAEPRIAAPVHDASVFEH